MIANPDVAMFVQPIDMQNTMTSDGTDPNILGYDTFHPSKAQSS